MAKNWRRELGEFLDRFFAVLPSLDLHDVDHLESLTDDALNQFVALSLTFKKLYPEAYERWCHRVRIDCLDAQLDDDPGPSTRPH